MDTCGAKTRAGTPCGQKTTYWNGRCKFHGGLATGPKTDAGKEQARINGRKGGRPRKDGGETQPHGDGNSGVTLDTVETVAMPVQETEVMGTEKTGVSAQFDGEVLGRAAEPEMSNLVHISPRLEQPESSTEKPKSRVLKQVKVLPRDAKVLPRCDRCTMFAGSGACLAVAKGLIPSMPTDGDCAGFIDFKTP